LEIRASGSHRTNAVEKEKPVPRAELLQSERRAFVSLNIDPVGDRELGSMPSCDALGHGYTRNSDCDGVYAVASSLTTALAALAVLPWNWLVKL
jgi:hypothetical protein